jgi:hypothetical protein
MYFTWYSARSAVKVLLWEFITFEWKHPGNKFTGITFESKVLALHQPWSDDHATDNSIYISYWHVNNPIDYTTSQISQISLMDSVFEKPYVQNI